MTNNKAITLIELLIAISLLVLIIMAGTGIYLSGWNMFRDAQYISQAHRNALIPMMHITKQLQQGTSIISGTNTSPLIFNIDFSNTPANLADDHRIAYTFVSASNQITCNRTPPSGSATPIFTANYITNCSFTYNSTIPVVRININATDNNGGNTYSLSTSTELRYTSAR